MRPRHSGLRVAALIAALALAAGCGGNEATTSEQVDSPSTTGSAGGADADARPGGSLTIGVEAAAESIDPLFGNGGATTATVAMAQDALYDALATRDGNGRIKPHVAESWEPNADSSVWTVKIRSGVKFSDGSPLDATAVAANYSFRKDPANGCRCAPKYAPVTATASGPDTVTFTLTKPDAHLPETMFFDALLAPASMRPGSDRDRSPIGSGPFRLSDRTSLTFERNPEYWRKDERDRPLPYLEGLKLAPIPDPTVRLAALQRGEVDLMEVTDGPTLAQAEDEKNFTVDRAAGGTTVVILNTSRPAVADPRVRRAVALAADREALASSYLPGAFEPAYSFFTSNTSIQVTTEYPKRDLAEAKRLVGEVKAEKGAEALRLKIICAKLPEAEALLPVASNQLAEAGFEPSLTFLDVGAYAAQVLGGGGDWDLSCTRIGSLAADPAQLADFLVTGRAPNAARYSNPEVDALFEKDRTTTAPEERQAIYQQVSDMVAEDLPYIPLLSSSVGTVLGPTAAGGTTIDLSWPTKPETELLWRKAS